MPRIYSAGHPNQGISCREAPGLDDLVCMILYFEMQLGGASCLQAYCLLLYTYYCYYYLLSSKTLIAATFFSVSVTFTCSVASQLPILTSSGEPAAAAAAVHQGALWTQPG